VGVVDCQGLRVGELVWFAGARVLAGDGGLDAVGHVRIVGHLRILAKLAKLATFEISRGGLIDPLELFW
jgi:hypothetical protein